MLKRSFDIVASAFAAVLLWPLILLIWVAVRLDSPGPAIFTQIRDGMNGVPFVIYKFRTMRTGRGVPSERLGKDDERFTRAGRWLRPLHFDELPQLFNVLKGDMSIVGPRPPIPYEVAKYRPEHLRRLAVVPGLTGYWQVKGRGRVTFDDMCALDAEYIDKRSMALDLWIIVRTPAAMLKGSG